MKLRQYHKSVQQALIITAKFGFITKEIFLKYIGLDKHLSSQYRQWGNLMTLGFLRSYNRVGVAEDYYSLSKKGYAILKDNGFEVVTKTHPLHFEHDGIVMNFAMAAELNSLIEADWITERELRHFNKFQQLQKYGNQFEKWPDLIFKIELGRNNLNCALEVERSRKSKAEYDLIVLSYAKDKIMNMVVVVYKDKYVRNSILKSINRLNYPQSTKPFVFCQISDVLKDPIRFQLEVGNNVIAFDQYVKNMKKLSAQKQENTMRIDSRLNSQNKETAA